MHTRSTRRTILGALLLLALPTPGVTACAAEPAAAPAPAQARPLSLAELAELAVADDPAVAADARTRLRAAGPAGLAALLARHPAAPPAPAAAPSGALARLLGLSPGTAADTREADALDSVCAQKDCAAARLYWYTDLAAARDAARASGKPILSLRLLGDLTDELSCANSRFFRALLYPDPTVGAILREQFVLHWQSERPAPKITIDLGDGRSVETTITGNSVHYVLDAAGRPVDALPGLVEPAVFADGLRRAGALARAAAALEGEAFAAVVRRHHEARLGALVRAWDDEMRAIGQPSRTPPQPRLAAPEPAPRAGRAAPIAVGKMAVEAPLLRGLGEPVETLSEAELFERLADRHAPAVGLSDASLAMIREQQWRTGDPARDAAELAEALAALRRAVALDTLRNEYDLHKQIHQRFVAAAAQDLEPLNRWLYSELFLTPRGDPWLGLASPTIYSGLPGGGRRVRI
ncbi:MAG: hypothetical protein JNL82_27925 [Myxococcales bacterium]|nr:hypothetical protein [Myxococcales bacterium]